MSTVDDVIHAKRRRKTLADFSGHFNFAVVQCQYRVDLLLLCGDGLWKGQGCGVSGHGLLLCSGGAEDQSRSEKHSVCRGPVQDLERRRVSL